MAPKVSMTDRPSPAGSGTDPEPVRNRILALALEAPELSARELAVRFTDQEKYFVCPLRLLG